MSANRYDPHVLIISEDDANRQIAVGFSMQCTSKQLIIETEVGGWLKVRDRFLSRDVKIMRRYTSRFVIMLIDCDGRLGRVAEIRSEIPQDVADRTFILGCKSEPEDLRTAGLGSFEKIGISIAEECSAVTTTYWNHDLLSHNISELANLREAVCDILWPK